MIYPLQYLCMEEYKKIDPSKHPSAGWVGEDVLLVIAKFTCGTKEEPQNYRPINLNSI